VGSPDKPSAIVSAIEGHSANIDVTYANGQPAAHLAYADDNPLAGLLVIDETGSPVAAFPDREAVAQYVAGLPLQKSCRPCENSLATDSGAPRGNPPFMAIREMIRDRQLRGWFGSPGPRRLITTHARKPKFQPMRDLQ
jgi:hypothetical protein